jgi:hypothetical protein
VLSNPVEALTLRDDQFPLAPDELMRKLSLLVLLATSLNGCSNEPEYSDQQRACIAKLYSSYDAKQMGQCVNVCKSCMGGNTVTCTTSCNLKGAR